MDGPVLRKVNLVNLWVGAWLVLSSLLLDDPNYSIGVTNFLAGTILFALAGGAWFFERSVFGAETVCGFWLLLSPLLLGPCRQATSVNATIAAVAVLACSSFLPGFLSDREAPGCGFPRGWTMNPSAWTGWNRGFLFSLALVAFLVSLLLRLPEWVGTLSLAEAMLVAAGGGRRWRTKPWAVVALFFVIVGGAAALVLAGFGKVTADAEAVVVPWMIALAFQLAMFPSSWREYRASRSLLAQAKKAGRPRSVLLRYGAGEEFEAVSPRTRLKLGAPGSGFHFEK